MEAGGKGERSLFRKDRVRRNSIKMLFLLSDVGEFGDSTSTPVARVAAASEKLGSEAGGKGERSRFLKDSVWRGSNKVLFLLSDVGGLEDCTSTPVVRVAAASEKSGSGDEEDDEMPLGLGLGSPSSCVLKVGLIRSILGVGWNVGSDSGVIVASEISLLWLCKR